MPKVYEAFGFVPPNIPPSQPVRYWHNGLAAFAFVFAVVYPASLGIAWLVPGLHLVRYDLALKGGLATFTHFATAGISLREPAREFLALASIHNPVGTAWRVGGALALALAAATWAARRALVPLKNEWHTAGPQLLEGEQSIQEARRRSLTKKEREADPFHLALHPDLVLGKRHWSRHTLVYGSSGSGKTVLLLPILEQLVQRRQKAFVFDVKGDITAKFPLATIVSPFDARSRVWDIGRDVRTPTQAAAFAASLIHEEEGSGKFWSVAAQQLLIGSIRFLQDVRGVEWGWSDLASTVAQGAEEMLPMLQAHYPKAAPLVGNSESSTTGSVLATLAGYTRVIDDLALAWPKRTDRMFSITDWVRDDYTGRRQVIVQAGTDPQMTRAYVSAMLNVAVPAIVSPQLPDDEQGRMLAFVLDELPSLGRIAIGPLVDKGRSKGVVCVFALQDLAQLRQVYGENDAKSIASMVGTHVICQIQMGETRDALAQQLGKHKVAWRTHDDKTVLHEESKNLVAAGELTDKLGFRRGKRYGAEKWGIRAIVQMGHDPLLLDFPGRTFPNLRPGQVPAKWTRGPAGAVKTPTPAPTGQADTQRVLAMTLPEIQAEMQRVYGECKRELGMFD